MRGAGWEVCGRHPTGEKKPRLMKKGRAALTIQGEGYGN